MVSGGLELLRLWPVYGPRVTINSIGDTNAAD